MDADSFDTLARSFTIPGSRRRALAALSGVLGLAVGASSPDEVDAKRKKKPCPPCKKRKKGKCKPQPNGTACNGGSCQNGSCIAAGAGPTTTQPCVPDCEVKQCGGDGCGGSCGDCGGTCSGGFCACLDGTYDCRFVNGQAICCPNDQACLGTQAPSCGACPAGADYCSPTTKLCGVTPNGESCRCTTSVQNTTTCTSLAGFCFACTTDAQCEDLFDAPAVCVNLASCGASACVSTGQKACVVRDCVDLSWSCTPNGSSCASAPSACCAGADACIGPNTTCVPTKSSGEVCDYNEQCLNGNCSHNRCS